MQGEYRNPTGLPLKNCKVRHGCSWIGSLTFTSTAEVKPIPQCMARCECGNKYEILFCVYQVTDPVKVATFQLRTSRLPCHPTLTTIIIRKIERAEDRATLCQKDYHEQPLYYQHKTL